MMKALPRIKASSAIAAAQQQAQGLVIMRTGVGPDISSGRTGLMKGERTDFNSPAGSPNLGAAHSFKRTSRYAKGKKRFG
jgi:hypothetical protein